MELNGVKGSSTAFFGEENKTKSEDKHNMDESSHSQSKIFDFAQNY